MLTQEQKQDYAKLVAFGIPRMLRRISPDRDHIQNWCSHARHTANLARWSDAEETRDYFNMWTASDDYMVFKDTDINPRNISANSPDPLPEPFDLNASLEKLRGRHNFEDRGSDHHAVKPMQGINHVFPFVSRRFDHPYDHLLGPATLRNITPEDELTFANLREFCKDKNIVFALPPSTSDLMSKRLQDFVDNPNSVIDVNHVGLKELATMSRNKHRVQDLDEAMKYCFVPLKDINEQMWSEVLGMDSEPKDPADDVMKAVRDISEHPPKNEGN